MSRGLIRSLLIALLAGLAAPVVLAAEAPTPTARQRRRSSAVSLARQSAPTAYRALRHLDACNERMEKTAWMDVWTEADREGGFKYTVVAEGGSGYIRSKVFLASLEKERKMYASGDAESRGAHARQLRLRR